MSRVPDHDPKLQELDRAISIVAAGLTVLSTRDHLAIPNDLALERARNIVAALAADFALVPIRFEAVEALREANGAVNRTVSESRAVLLREVGQ